MKKLFSILITSIIFCIASFAQKHDEDKKEKKVTVPAAVKASLKNKYPAAGKVTWEKEKGNYEANWGGKSGEDNSVQFMPNGEFIEMIKTIPVSELPAPVIAYIQEHYKGAKITEAGKVTDAREKITYEAEVNKKDIVFTEKGDFVKAED